MKKYFALLVLLFFLLTNSSLLAQEGIIDYSVIAKIRDQGFNHSKVMESLFNMTDVNGPRLTGSQNLKQTQQWSINQLKEWGITHAQAEAWGTFGKGWEIEKSYIAMTVPYYQPLIAIPKAWTKGTNGLINASAVLISMDTSIGFENYKGKLRGKIVVIGVNNEVKLGLTPEARRYTEKELYDLETYAAPEESTDDHTPAEIEKYKNMRKFRQKLNTFLDAEQPALILNSRGGTMGTFYTTNGASYATDATPAIPELEMPAEHLNRLIRLLVANKEVKIEAEIKTRFNVADTLQYNVIAEIPGTDKKLKGELVMIGAHLDSWHAATGATDNAAGCAVMMEVMRILKTLDLKPKRTIRMALWSGEEQGILGSKAYVKNHFGDLETMAMLPDYTKLSAYYNLDNGGGKIRGIYLQENESLRQIFKDWFKALQDSSVQTVTFKSTGSTDHIPFDKIGLPGLQFIQDPLDYFNKTHHTNMDTYDRIQKEDLMQASVVIASLVFNTAMRNEKLPRKPLPEKKKVLKP